MVDHRDILRLCVHAFYAVIVLVLLGSIVGVGETVAPLGSGAGLALIWIMWSTVRLMGRR